MTLVCAMIACLAGCYTTINPAILVLIVVLVFIADTLFDEYIERKHNKKDEES